MKFSTFKLCRPLAFLAMGRPLYRSKPYVLIGNKEKIVLHAGDADSFKDGWFSTTYYDDCEIKVREYDLHANDNTMTKRGLTKAGGKVEKVYDKENRTDKAKRTIRAFSDKAQFMGTDHVEVLEKAAKLIKELDLNKEQS